MGMRFFCCNGRHDVEKQVAEQRAQIEILNAHGIQRSPLPLLHAEEVPIPVSLNVYSLTERNKKLAKLGIGVFHTGVVVYGIEWGYGEAMDSPNSSGLFCVTPGHAAGSLYKSIRIGHTTKTPAQVDTILHRMENEWRSNEYHILHHNCNHFAQALCDALSNGTNKLVVPAWCNRAARLSDKILPKKLATKVQRMLDDEPPHAVPAAARPSNIADIPISVIPRHWYLQPNIYPSSRNRTLMSYRNASTMTTTSTDVPAPGAHALTNNTAQAKHSPVPTNATTTPPATHEEHHTHHHTHTTETIAAQLAPAAKPSAPTATTQAADHVAAPPPPQPPLRTPRAVADEVAVPHAAPKKATITNCKNGGVPDMSKRATAALSPLPQALSPSPPAPATTATTTATITTPVITTAMSDGMGVVYSPVSGHGGEDNDETTRLASSNTPSDTPRHEEKQKAHSPAVVSLTSQLRAITEELHQATATTPLTHQLSEAEPRRLSAEAVSSPASDKTKASLQPTPVTPPMADLPRTTTSPMKAEVNSDTKDVPSRFVRTQLLAQAVTVGTPKSAHATLKALPTMVPAALPSPRAPPLASSPVVHSLASSSVSSSSLHSSVSWVAKHAKASPSGKKNEAMSPPFMDMARGRQTNIAALVKYGTPVASPRSPVMAQTLPRMQCVSHDEGFAQTTKAEQSTRGQQQKELGGFTVAAALRNASPRPRLRRSASDSDMYVQRNRSRYGPTAPQLAKDVDTTTAAALQQQALYHEQQGQQACNRQVQSARQSPHAPGFTGNSVLFTHVYELHSAPTPAAAAPAAVHKSPIHATELMEEITGFVKPYSASDEEEDSMERRRGTGHEGQGCAVKTSSGTERSARLLLSQRPRLSTSSSSRGHSQRRQKQRSEIVSPMTDRLLSSPASARLALQQTPPPQHRHTAAPASPNGHLPTTTTPLKASPRGAVFADSTPCRTSPEPHSHHHHNHHEHASGSRGRDTVALSPSASRERNEASMTITPGVVLSLPLSPTAESVLTPPLKSSVPASLKSDKHRRKDDKNDDEEDVQLTSTTTTESERSIASAP